MYSVTVKRDFIAQHFLIGGDWGAENKLHSHHYRVEVKLEGTNLDAHGYLVDIVDIEQHVDALVKRYSDCTLNDLPQLHNLNPSLERFAQLFQEALTSHITAPTLSKMTVTIWENELAWASYRSKLAGAHVGN